MMHKFFTGPEQLGVRLDQFLQQQSTGLSRSRLRMIIDIGGVHVDGRRVRKNSLTLAAGQEVIIHLDGRPLEPFRVTPEHVLYQDKHLIALNKPAGVDTQPTPARYKGTLYEALQVWLERDRRFGRKLEIGMVQRLDRDTSGVIVFSIHPRSHQALTRQMLERRLGKSYLALVSGCPEPPVGEYRSLLARERRTGKMHSVTGGGSEAVTRYRVLHREDDVSLVEVELVTGRMHQIRAHFAEAGHALVGDLKYGGPDHCGNLPVKHQYLHSWRLCLDHPISGQRLVIRAPLPSDEVWRIAAAAGVAEGGIGCDEPGDSGRPPDQG